MEQLDKVILGDNQFFGINHRSQDKAEEMLKRFSNLDNIFEVYDNAFDCGVKAVMLNSNETAVAICDRFRANKSKYGDVAWYPSIPYAYKYANMVNELGIFPAVNEVLFKGNTTGGVLSMIGKGASAVLGKDAMKMMEMLIDEHITTLSMPHSSSFLFRYGILSVTKPGVTLYSFLIYSQ